MAGRIKSCILQATSVRDRCRKIDRSCAEQTTSLESDAPDHQNIFVVAKLWDNIAAEMNVDRKLKIY